MKNIFKGAGVSSIAVGGLAIVLIGGAVAYGVVRKSDKAAQVAPTPSPADAPYVPEPTPTPVTGTGDRIVDAGVTWTARKELGDLKLFTLNAEYFPGEKVEYYKVGTDNGKDIVYAVVPSEGPSIGGDGDIVVVRQVEGTSYEILLIPTRGDAEYEFDREGSALSLTDRIVSQNKVANYASVMVPARLTIGASVISTYSTNVGYSVFFKPSSTDIRVKDTPYGPLYRVQILDGGDMTVAEKLQLVSADGNAHQYDLEVPFVTDDDKVAISWNDGTKTENVYYTETIHQGCGVGGSRVLKGGSLSGWMQTGTAKGGVAIYEPEPGSAILRSEYDDFKGMYFDEASGDMASITFEEWQKKHPLLGFKDDLGRVLLLGSSEYTLQAECGKPVVYLYPEKTESVSVKVAADVTKSEPSYGNGWNVIARPDGKLTMANGSTFDSLFWEGLGHGPYPEITAGFVVKKEAVEATLRDHLLRLGLNAKESADFLEFWLPLMPKDPYVRLTWFGTRDMDRLAPLTVSPKPDTSIRVFLDFEGLEKPVFMPEQRLTAVERKGFTLVEWGGLLR